MISLQNMQIKMGIKKARPDGAGRAKERGEEPDPERTIPD